MAKVEEQKFHFAIGKPWNPEEPNGSVGFYTYGSEIFYCTLNEAIGMRDSFNLKSKTGFFPDKGERGGYRIYQVTEVANSEHMMKIEMPEKKRVKVPKKADKLTLADISKAAAEEQLAFYKDLMDKKNANTKKLPLKKKKT